MHIPALDVVFLRDAEDVVWNTVIDSDVSDRAPVETPVF